MTGQNGTDYAVWNPSQVLAGRRDEIRSALVRAKAPCVSCQRGRLTLPVPCAQVRQASTISSRHLVDFDWSLRVSAVQICAAGR